MSHFPRSNIFPEVMLKPTTTAWVSSFAPRNHRVGMSLVELLVVMAIMASLMGLVFAAFTGVQRAGQLTGEAEGVAGILREARGQAMAYNTVVRVDFRDASPDERQRRGIPAGETAHAIQLNRFPSVWNFRSGSEENLYTDTVVLEGVVFEELPDSVFFYPNGGVQEEVDGSGPGLATVPIRQRGMRVISSHDPTSVNWADLFLSGLTGNVEIRRPEAGQPD